MTKTTNYLCHPSSASFTLVRNAEVFLKEYQSHLLRSSCQIILNKIVYDPSEFPVCHSVVPAILKRYVKLRRRVASGGGRGAMPPDFRFCPPPNFFLAPSTVFFGRKKLVFLGGKNVKICDFGEDLFFFGDHLLLVGKFVILSRKSLQISAKTLFFWRSPAFGRKFCDFCAFMSFAKEINDEKHDKKQVLASKTAARSCIC